MSAVEVRLAKHADLDAIRNMYNHYVLHSDCTFRIEPQKPEETLAWFEQRKPEHPVVVAEKDGAVVGWSAISPYLFRCAYRRTVENSVYVRSDLRRSGIGKAMLEDIIRRAQTLGHHCIIALVTSTQLSSLRLHESVGYKRSGYLKEVGYKFDRWLDVVIMQRLLND